ncbi:MAG: hydantoinase B/oxoprolinase family protein [Parvibaculaceae bacterium]
MNYLAAKTTDPIKIEILRNALRSITDECFVSLMKSAYSTNIKERQDHSTAIVDAKGHLIAQTMASPIHIASMMGLMTKMVEKFAGPDGRFPDLLPGDIFVGNDPHVAGGTHLPDVNMVAPVFLDGRIMAFVCNIAHHADIGGMVPGSMAGGMTEIYQEGLRIPLVRLFRGGVLQQDILDLLLLNVRLPHERRGDYFAQIAAINLGINRLTDVATRHGASLLTSVFEEIKDRTERRMRQAISTIPDGTYTFTDVMDDDGLEARNIPIKVVIDVSGEHIRFNFEGTAPQVPGNINVTLNATIAAVCFALQALLDPDCPNNQGVLRVIETIAPEGSLLNARAPASVAARAHTCQRIIDVVMGALTGALPERAIGASNGANTTAVFSGVDPRTGHGYVYLETLGGGHGARASKDGKDGVQVNITNTSNLPVEAIEFEYPLLVEEYSLVPNSGGAGRQRGGLGIRRVLRPVGHDCRFNGAGERFSQPPWGVFGGKNGACGHFGHRTSDGKVKTLPSKPNGMNVTAGEAIIVETPGAGGYGPPAQRSKAALAADERSGKYSNAFLEEFYPILAEGNA